MSTDIRTLSPDLLLQDRVHLESLVQDICRAHAKGEIELDVYYPVRTQLEASRIQLNIALVNLSLLLNAQEEARAQGSILRPA